ncbi:MAG: TIGR04282 family arsenosugar biosynthesis glycosyltransferase [Myxococcota bacterium]
MSRGWLVVFAKAPRPGLVKTRLSPPLSLDQSAALYADMLADVLSVSAAAGRALGLEPVLAHHPPDAAGELVGYAPPGVRLQAQRGRDLGERMANAFAEGFAAGAGCMLLRGSDSPALEPACIRAALDGLEAGFDLVLTPDLGGGYAMIGLRRPQPSLFEVEMSTDSMRAATIERAERAGLRVSLTAPTPDLDTAADFRSLYALPRDSLLDLCPRTVRTISDPAFGTVL